MIPFFCDSGWLECLKEALLGAAKLAIDGLITLIFNPIFDELAKAVGSVMATIGTFWIYIKTPAIGTESGKPGFAVDWIWQHTAWIAVFAATIGVIVAGCQMAWSQRGESVRELLRSLFTLAIASTMAIAVTQVLLQAGDKFSECIVSTSLDEQGRAWVCNAHDANAAGFGRAMLLLLGLAAPTGTLGVGLMIAIAIIALLASLIQVVMMVVRYAMVILLVGVLPIAAAATNTEMGKGWFKRVISWLVAFILYKPVAALIYATAIKLTSVATTKGPKTGPLAYTGTTDGDKIMNMVTGVTMLVLALFALPALMRFIAPMVSATAGAAGAGMLAAKMLGADKAAEKVSDSTSKQSGDGDGPTGSDNPGPQRPPTQTGRSSPRGGGEGGGGGGEGGASGGEAGGGGGGASGGAGGGASGGAAAGGSGAAAGGGGAAAGGAAAGGGGAAAGGAAAGAGAAAGPVGIAVAAAAIAVKKGIDMAKEGVEAVGEEVDSMDEGPSGSG